MTNISVNRTENNVPSDPLLSVSLEAGKQYCIKLTKLLLRHSRPAEVEQLINVLEDQAKRQIASRYNPGLNDARYDLYRRTWLGGESA